MKDKIRIASGQGFWGDLIDAPYHQVTKGEIDYLVMDYLAEVTMSILQKQKNKNPDFGYARDIPDLMKRILPAIKEKKIKVVTNGGGVNPVACAEAVINVAKELKINDLKIGVILGDDISKRIDEIIAFGSELNNMDTGESIKNVKDKLLSANVYFGAFPIVEALKRDADIVITGRTTDTGLTLAPMIYEFGWKPDDYNLLSAGTVAGHILECGAQSSGGNFLGDWESIPNMAEIGFPIAEAYPNGEVVITKHKNTGGRVSFETVAEQLVYEIGDPVQYITPDCVADFTTIKLDEIRSEFVGYNSTHENLATELDEDKINEILLRFSVRAKDRNTVNRFGQEIAPLILTGPPSVTGFAGGRPKPKDVIAYWPALIRKTMVVPKVKILM